MNPAPPSWRQLTLIRLQTGHKNIAVLRRYIREGSVFHEHAAAAVGL